MKVAILCFGPFGGRSVNGSKTIAEMVAKFMLSCDAEQVNIIEVPVRWQALRQVFTEGWLDGYDMVIGLGEGWHDAVVVEKIARRVTKGTDEDGLTAPDDMFPVGGLATLESPMVWSGTVETVNLGLPKGSPGVRINTDGSTFLCNAANYWLLWWAQQKTGRRAGFIHVPPQQEWEQRNKLPALRYGWAFGPVIIRILSRNAWIG